MFARRLISTISQQPFPFSRIEEYADNGEALEVQLEGVEHAKIRTEQAGVLKRYANFIPFNDPKATYSLGEGDTPLLEADASLKAETGIENLWIKDETRNPTGSFKDRGSLFCLWMADEMGESALATVSTGNMGHSIAAYAARSGKRALIFVPEFAPMEKVLPMAFFGGSVPAAIKSKSREDLLAGFATLKRHARFAPYVAGDTFTLADIVFLYSVDLAATVGKQLFDLDLLGDLPAAKTLLQRLGENPHVKMIAAKRDAGMPAFVAAGRARLQAAS